MCGQDEPVTESVGGADPAGEQAPAPLALRAAVGVWLALAVFGLVNAGYLWLVRDGVRRVLVEQQHVRAEQAAAVTHELLVDNSIAAVVLAVAYAGLGLLLRAGRGWARIGLSAVAGVHLLLVLSAGGRSVQNVFAVLLVLAGLVLTWRSTASSWLAAMRSR